MELALQDQCEEATDYLAANDPLEFAQIGGVPPIGFQPFSLFELDENHLVAAVVAEYPDQPIVKATDFEHYEERFVATLSLAREVLKESVDLLRLCRDLPSLQDIPFFVAE